MSKSGICGVDYQRRPRDRRKAQSIEDVREIRAIERIVNVDVEEGFQFQPADGQVVPPGLEAVAHADARDRPVIDRIDRGVLREIDRVEFGRGLNAVKLEDGRGIDVRGRDTGKVGERLNDVTQRRRVPDARFCTWFHSRESLNEPSRPALKIERKAAPVVGFGIPVCGLGNGNSGASGSGGLGKSKGEEDLRLAVVGLAESTLGTRASHPKISVRIGQLVERIDPKSAVILVDRPGRKIQAQLAGTGFTFVENWTAKRP